MGCDTFYKSEDEDQPTPIGPASPPTAEAGAAGGAASSTSFDVAAPTTVEAGSGASLAINATQQQHVAAVAKKARAPDIPFMTDTLLDQLISCAGSGVT